MIVLLFMGSMLAVFAICFVVVLIAMVRSALAAPKEEQKPDKPARKPWFKRRRSVQEIQPPDIDEIEQVEQKDENPYD